MTDLHTLLEAAVESPEASDVAADVRRGHAALRRRRRALGAGLAVGALALSGGTIGIVRSQAPSDVEIVGPSGQPPGVRAGSFQIPAPPDGWAVQAAGKSLVVIAPDDLPHVDLSTPALQLRVMGKLVVALHSGADGDFQPGEPIEYDDRAFHTWVDPRSPDYPHQPPIRMVSVAVPSGGWLVLQEAPALHWTAQQMIEFLDGVVVLPGATTGD